jgi:hypothetical protein
MGEYQEGPLPFRALAGPLRWHGALALPASRPLSRSGPDMTITSPDADMRKSA